MERRKRLHSNPAIANLASRSKQDSVGIFAERHAWFEANELPGFYGPKKFCSREYADTHREELALQKFTVGYLKRQMDWRPRPNTTWRDYAVEAAAASVNEGLRHLQYLASQGDTKALNDFAFLVHEMVNILNRFALSEPHGPKLIPFGRTCLAWPALKGRREVFSDDHVELIRVLQIGKDTIFGKDSQSRFNPKRRFARVAMELIERIERARTLRTPPFFAKIRPPKWAEAARKLLPYSKAASPEWWAVAQRVLEDDFADQAKAEAYNSMVSAPSHERRQKSVFINKIREEFDTLADIHRQKK